MPRPFQALNALLEDDNKFGFIVMDGNGALFGTLSGNTRDVMHKFTVDLPKKHGNNLHIYSSILHGKREFILYRHPIIGRGGQSALRFARLRLEKRHNYVRKVAETAVQMFITNDRPNVSGLVLAGSADFKTELSQSDMFDQVSCLEWRALDRSCQKQFAVSTCAVCRIIRTVFSCSSKHWHWLLDNSSFKNMI